jgi:cytochrome c-type biogenesis protein CcmH/NrfG
MQRRFDEAEAAYQRALEIAPDNANARHNLALLAQTRQSDELPDAQIKRPPSPDA